jgi:hypothetical protein
MIFAEQKNQAKQTQEEGEHAARFYPFILLKSQCPVGDLVLAKDSSAFPCNC